MAPRTKQANPPESLPTITDPQNSATKSIPIESIIEYRKKGLTTREIATLLNCSHPNIVQRLQTVTADVDSLDSYKIHRADILALNGRRLLSHVTDEKLQKASAYQLAGMYGILYDKERLERGQTTANVGYADYTRSVAEMDKEISRLEAELGAVDED